MTRGLRWLSLMIAAVSVPLAARQARFTARVDNVRVDALVTAGGRPLAGLAATDFEVLDNGIPQRVDLLSSEQMPLDVVLALDMSGSVEGERLDHLRDAGRALVDGLSSADHAALVTFSHVVSLQSPLTSDFSRIRGGLDRAPTSGTTSLHDATYAGLVAGASGAGRGLLIVFSDGVDTASWLSADETLEAARHGESVIYAVAVGETRPNGFLNAVSTSTGGRLLNLASTRDARSAFVGILDEFRHRYLLSYTPRGVSTGGWHRLEVRVRDRRAKVNARPGYWRDGG